MGLIKEPTGVDFIVKSRALTKEEESAISAYIAAYKAKSKQDKKRSKSKSKPKRTRKVATQK